MKAAGFVAFVLIVTGFAYLWSQNGGPGWYGAATISLLAMKLVLSWTHREKTIRTGIQRERLRRIRVGVALPMYNEDPAMLAACLRSLLAQSRRMQSIVVVDDGSTTLDAFEEAERWIPRFAEEGVHLEVLRFSQNRGKRAGLIACLDAQPTAELLLCVDSDTVLDERALEEALIPFLKDDVTVVTGLVLALNFKTNLLTRLIDLRYANAFLFERAAYSKLGSVLCACGSLAVYRTDVMRKYAFDFLNQQFLGRPAVFGDDRRMTNYGLLEGKAVFQQTAIAYTTVPERLGHYVRQQVRWNKSFFRESIWVLRRMPLRKPAFWLTFLELATWAVFSAALVYALGVAPIATGSLLIAPYLVYISLIGYARSVRYLDLTGVRQTRKDLAIGFLLSPLFGLLHIFLLVWLRLWSLVTLRSGAWGTRSSVEVSFSALDAARVLQR
ncbi:MAG: glycosyltransferase [Leifsonia sp.]